MGEKLDLNGQFYIERDGVMVPVGDISTIPDIVTEDTSPALARLFDLPGFTGSILLSHKEFRRVYKAITRARNQWNRAIRREKRRREKARRAALKSGRP